MRRLIQLGTLSLLPIACPALLADEAAKKDPAAIEFFEREIRPLLVGKCQSCHGEKKVRGGLRLPVRPVAPPSVANAVWARTEIDQFVLAELEKRGIPPARPADRRTLLRRATFDLTGLPPTPEEVEAFSKDDSPNAFAKVVDRLLASPAYGQRWGRHWLDVVRYADYHDGNPTTRTAS